ncbi:MAG: Fic family protein [Gemmatimonadales bacterium]|nr:Fic family protein [Gemmatimonadales bacterium]MYC87878.1 Fic family protein [Candidatus Palauibacter denitrificans]
MNELDAAIAEWHRVRGDIAPEDDERLWQKLRLEWNYNSNHIEGNTLTYDETVLLLLHDQVAGSHPMRDYEEMKAHNVAIELVRQLSTAEQPLTEADIRELNRKLLKEPFWKTAETPDGGTTRKWIEPGKYKTQPNHVRTRTGELHRFAEPEETPSRMEEWVRRLRNDLDRTDYPLPEFLAESHWSFANIHPFDDGNGRTARLITNYILLRKDLLPIVIKSADRDRYLAALRQADAGNGQPLADFMRAQLLWSLDLGVRAARAEPIADPEDLDKEISLFVEGRRPRETIKFDAETVDAIYDLDVRPTVEALDQRMEKFVPLFRDCTGTSFIVAGSCRMEGRAVLQAPDWDRFRADPVFDTDGFALGLPDITLMRRYNLGDYCGPSDQGFSLLLEVKWLLGTSGRRFTATINGKVVEGASQGLPLARLETESTNVEERVETICRAVMGEIRLQSQQPDPA